jgi:translocation and assembly module TamB
VLAAAFAPFWPGRIPDARLQEMKVRAVWNNGPLQLSSRFAAAWRPQPGTELSLEAEARTDAQGIHFAPFIFRQETNEVLQLTGVIPVEIRPASAERIAWREAERFNVRLTTLSSDVLDRELAYWTGWEVADARVNLTATGGPAELLAELAVRAASLRPAAFTNLPVSLTTLSNLAFQASASRGELTLQEGRFQVAGQPVRLTGRLPLDANNWSNWQQQLRAPDWRRMAGELNLPEMPMAALAPLLGEVFTPAGQASLQARLEPGGRLGGQLSFTNLTTRPFEPAGSLRELAGEVALAGQRATIRHFSTTLGGQWLRVNGSLGWDERGIADMAFALTGTNVALVRSADLFLRSDLNLSLQATNHTPPVLSGEVRLRESLFFQDLATLTRIDLNRPELRPPYFSISTPPLDAWRLDLRVTGQRFLKVISPVFRGEVSSGLRLGGTLREPRASGEVTVDNGRMTFPFGALELTRGAVRLTQTDPYRPQLDFQGQGMNFGYQLQMHLSGAADAPNLAFTSVPPLSTRQILLMLSAGEIPSGSFEFTDADKVSRLGFYLGKELMTELLGQDTTEERLNIRTGEHVTSDGRLTYDVEYKLGDRFSLFGEYSRFQDYNGGLKFKVYSR